MLKPFITAAALAVTPTLALSAGGDSDPPKPTNTVKKCLFGRVWDADARRCVKPNKTNFTQDELYQAVRELAYDGQYRAAQDVLRAMPDQSDDRVLTYWGFTHRKLGEVDLANMFYRKAIADNPDNLLARSYMGQGFVAEGRMDLAVAQWREIRTRGGTGTWAEISLRNAIRTGASYNY